ncbi:hybrid sensor histidine kinase/response regulator transcription factor [Marinicella meishanensis]|uniref:hybrid sensor histidine kinase/response regulator transcription factor n=1 Tax=Marinicella meishanensis TaxID=2873263 RepID=UPI001CBEC686|nr:ATP-binding protein [Marinicella sp. NBU2979]
MQVNHITGLASDNQGGFLLASEEVVLVHVDHQGQIEDLSGLFETVNNQPLIYEMIWVDDALWLSSDMGIYRLNSNHSEVLHFGPEDGSINGGFIKKASHLGASGTVYFGGKQGLVAFKPEAIKTNLTAPKIVITKVNQLNKSLTMGEQLLGGFQLNQDVNQLKKMQLNHQDLTIGFEFAALDYASPEDNRYAFRLLGFNDTWNMVDAKNRTATYTNLNPGEYTFEVKAANKDGVWTEQPKSLAITVKPAPWFSPLAYALYVLTFVVALFAFIRYRTAAANRRAQQLEVEVNQRTQELKTQKQMVESLLDHKNELFANVTHEFKTPLALIKGPTDELLKEGELYPHKSKLNMIKRNANRLLVMVGQILKLSEVEQEQAVVRENQTVEPVLNMLFEAYAILARDKNIRLHLDNQSKSQIHATAEYLEMVVGNLLSNAIKYTGVGGEVTLSSMDQDGQVIITVKDTGSGIAEQDQSAIFDRFTRLDSHRNIQGTGIGLAVVKEITQANGGQVSLISELGQGSAFTIRMPQAQWQELVSMESTVVDQMVQKTAHEMVEDQLPTTAKKRSAAIKLLVIEDNADMRTHIDDVLRDKYHCFYADRGQSGIATALKEMPDIIICDVMMPGMDGFQVTRILRHDAKTSHIPIILLTALNTKESRIKGWRENIDVYLTKPFDASELHATLGAVLNVRKILQQKTQASLGVSGTTENLDLPKQDLKFVKNLKSVIAENYPDIMFMRPQLASAMAVSERQLQRKVKALVDDSPMNLLRDYRLEMAAAKLAEGLQVGVVGDDCGFSSVSYFAACFKKKYGMTPKKYQMTVNKKT